MVIGNLTKYFVVFFSSLLGAVSGYLYSSKIPSLRIWIEKGGKKLLRSSDPLDFYVRIIKQKSEKIKKVPELKNLFEESEVEEKKLSEDQKSLKLLEWCEKTLTGKNWSLEKVAIELCEYPDWG